MITVNKIHEICEMIGEVSWKQSGINWTREKDGWRWDDFWRLLINIGCRFEKDTLTKIPKWSRSNPYNLNISMPDEGHYALAAQMGHISFCGAFENLVGRIPFITKGIYYSNTYERKYNVHNIGRTQGRLVMGCSFVWRGEEVYVTSFDDSKNALTACAYHPDKNGYRSKIKKRFKITNGDLRNQGKKRKRK